MQRQRIIGKHFLNDTVQSITLFSYALKSSNGLVLFHKMLLDILPAKKSKELHNSVFTFSNYITSLLLSSN